MIFINIFINYIILFQIIAPKIFIIFSVLIKNHVIASNVIIFTLKSYKIVINIYKIY